MTNTPGPNISRGITPGLPTNTGSFKAAERTDSVVALADAPPTSLAQALAESRYGNTLRVDEMDVATDLGADYIDVTIDPSAPAEERYLIRPVTEVNLVEDLAQYLSEHSDAAYKDAYEAATTWLANGAGDTVDRVISEQYGGENDDTHDWDMTQAVGFTTTVAEDATTEDLIEAASITNVSNFKTDYDSNVFFEQVLTQEAVTSGAVPFVDGTTYRRVLEQQVGRILSASGPAKAEFFAPTGMPVTPKEHRDANAAKVGLGDLSSYEGAINGRAASGDVLIYGAPSPTGEDIEYEVEDVVQAQDGSWTYRVHNLDNDEVFEDTLRGPMWHRTSWMLDEENED